MASIQRFCPLGLRCRYAVASNTSNTPERIAGAGQAAFSYTLPVLALRLTAADLSRSSLGSSPYAAGVDFRDGLHGDAGTLFGSERACCRWLLESKARWRGSYDHTSTG